MNLLFDIGGSQLRVAVSNNEKIEEYKAVETPQDPEEGLEILHELAKELLDPNIVTQVVGGLPGPLDARKSKLVYAPNLPAWVNFPIKENLKSKFNQPIYLENDAALAGLGEAVYGAGQNYDLMAYLTVSTGIGGARIVKQKIDVNFLGFEPGHHYLDIDQSLFLDSDYGTFEKYVSGEAIKKKISAGS